MTDPVDLDEEDGSKRWTADWGAEDWLVATQSGIWMGRPGEGWSASGPYEHSLNCLTRHAGGLVAGADGGLWFVAPGDLRWRQLHDEILTVVEAVVSTGDEMTDLVAATGYGVHLPQADAHQALRWKNHSSALTSPSVRFSTALHSLDPQTWLVGTEAGLFVAHERGDHWAPTAVSGTAVRALLSTDAGLLAGTDAGDIWQSANGRDWTHHSRIDRAPGILSLADGKNGCLLAGSTRGVIVFDGAWHATGPVLPMAAIAMDDRWPSTWVAGAAPGGLWWTTDGDNWQQVANTPKAIRHLLPPELSQ